MLHTRLAAFDAEPVGRGESWLLPTLILLAAATGALVAAVLGHLPIALIAGASGLAAALLTAVRGSRSVRTTVQVRAMAPDLSLIASSLSLCADPAALTDADGGLLSVNAAYRQRFAALPRPEDTGADEPARAALALARRLAWRDGIGKAEDVPETVEIERVGHGRNLLLWRFPPQPRSPLTILVRRIEGVEGAILAEAGILAAVVDDEGQVLAGNEPLRRRSQLREHQADLQHLLAHVSDGRVRFIAEGIEAPVLRLLHIPAEPDTGSAAGLTLLFTAPDQASVSEPASLQALLDLLPLGLALVDRDGRFLTSNKAFRAAAALGDGSLPAFPSDLVVKEDKAAVADAVRRNSRGPAMSGDLAVRLSHQPSEPVALTIAGLRNLGDASVLLLLKDNSEESKLKRQVAQATKMQAVGQLAGGVAHDFNNILTAIIGHCDLMLHRHEPGDSDYDDVQQIRSNSNRAASLTRQLLAFSRQQTLRPQLLQLPDVISEVSSLLRRLLGETVRLSIKHGRNLGAVRADPGQLEQVIVNLAVNARDAMPDGGTLTIQTFALPASEVRGLGVEVLPVADYTAMRVADTGSGIAPELLGKIFEPFFTTKEVGKGTGLGLSTVYGIVKQSGGFIFADSAVGEGTSFVVYLPVHEAAADEAPRAALPKEKPTELWGTGTVLLVEDEAMVRAVAERALTRHGYKVISANDGEQGLELLADGAEVDLLITDVVMPVMDGPTMVRAARATRPELPILFMSGYAEEQLRRSIDIERVHFIAKPFSVQQLAEAARDALAEGAVAE